MSKYVIACAGTGSRVRDLNPLLNKGLITLGDRPVLSRIIGQIPKDVDVIILTGYGAEVVEDVTVAIHPEQKITFVRVDPYEGPGSGLGTSLLAAESLLQCPFVFTTNDTLCSDGDLSRDPSVFGNWVIGATIPQDKNFDENQYRMLSQDGQGRLVEILPKGVAGDLVYTGICGVRDFKEFWSALRAHPDLTVGESVGVKALDNVQVFESKEWFDTGNLGMLKIAKQRFKSGDHHVLEKPSEAIWFFGDHVCKFSLDPAFISGRVERSKTLPAHLVPEIKTRSKHTYTYLYRPGQVLSTFKDSDIYTRALDIAYQTLWSIGPNCDLNNAVIPSLEDFYYKKTKKRVSDYFFKVEDIDRPLIINGRQTASCEQILESLDWNDIYTKAVLSSFHGDFHQENILYCEESGVFSFMDYRQDFAGSTILGDCYYDLAKFMHGLLVNHRAVVENQYFVKFKSHNSVEIDILRTSTSVEVEKLFVEWLSAKNFDVSNVYLLTGLIFLNIAPLHHTGYDAFLNVYGRYLLSKNLYSYA